MRTQRERASDERPDEHDAFEDEEEQEEYQDEQEQPDAGKLLPTRAPFSQVFGFGAGTFLAAGMLDMLAHLGPTGLVIGGIAAYVASRHGPDLYEQVRTMLPPAAHLPAEEASRYRAANREVRERRSLLDRAWGRFPDEEDEDEWQDENEGRSSVLTQNRSAGIERGAPALSFAAPTPPLGPMVALSPSVQVPLHDRQARPSSSAAFVGMARPRWARS